MTRYASPKRTTFAGQRTGKRFAFNRALLPTPTEYYRDTQGLKLIGTGEWHSTLCVFHDDKSPSLRINSKSGAFKCFVCDAKGGDVLAFHMQRHSLSFINACKALGAWSEQS